MDFYIAVLAGFGLIVLLTAWLPMVLRRLPLSLPIICVAIGAGVFAVPELEPVALHPLQNPVLTERISEFVVILALMGAGLKIDRIFGFKSWLLTWRLLGISMPLTIAGIAAVAYWMLDVPLAAALLLGAALAPTDPVLASDVQVGPPNSGEEDEIRFTLTSEAGLNDGLAFPFVNLAIVMAAHGLTTQSITDWVIQDVVWKLVVGAFMGWGIGTILGFLTFHLPNRAKLSRTGDGFVALGATCLSYGLTELVHGYGFVAVFVTALAIRAAERSHSFHEKLHDFSDQSERLLTMVLLVMFGGMLVHGELLAAMDLSVILFAVIVLLLIRPLAGLIGLLGTSIRLAEKLTISFFGIRGLGSVYYLAYALNVAQFPEPVRLWSALSLVVLFSIVLHGTAVTPTLSYVDRTRRQIQAQQVTEDGERGDGP